MNYIRLTRKTKYEWRNGVRSVAQNTQNPRNIDLSELRAIERGDDAQRQAERCAREERQEARRIEQEHNRNRMRAQQEDAIRHAALNIAAEEIAVAREDAERAERQAARHEAAMLEAARMVHNLQAVIRDAEKREGALRQVAQDAAQMMAVPQWRDNDPDEVQIVMPPPVAALEIAIERCNERDNMHVVIKPEHPAEPAVPIGLHSTMQPNDQVASAEVIQEPNVSAIQPSEEPVSLGEIFSGSLNFALVSSSHATAENALGPLSSNVVECRPMSSSAHEPPKQTGQSTVSTASPLNADELCGISGSSNYNGSLNLSFSSDAIELSPSLQEAMLAIYGRLEEEEKTE